MSYYGGYLTVKEDGTVDAITRTICDDNFIHIVYSTNNCKVDEINYIALRAINGKYLSILENEAASVDKIASSTELFKGYLYDEKNSNCYGREPQPEDDVEEPTKPDDTKTDDTDDTDDETPTTLTPTTTTIPKECLDLTNKIISIECKVVMDNIKKEAQTQLTRRRNTYRYRN